MGFSPLDSTYPPLDVLKPVAEGVWIVDSGPLRVFKLLPLPVRMTVVRLANGDLWLHSPTRFEGALRRAMEENGRIRHLIAPNSAHWSFVKAWQDNCPDLVTWAAPDLRERSQVKKSGVRLDRDLLDSSPAEWAGEIDQVIVPGGMGFREVDFLHRPTGTLILTDLVVSLEAEKVPPLARRFARMLGVVGPDGKAPAYLRAVVSMKRGAAREAARQMKAWNPERVIFSHGRPFERDGREHLRRSLAWLLG